MANNIYTSITRNSNLINRRNRRTFVPEENLFPDGGLFNTNLSSPQMAPYVNWSDPMQSKIATTMTKGIIDTFTMGNNDVAGNFGKGPMFQNNSIFKSTSGPSVLSSDASSFFNSNAAGAASSGATKSISVKPTTMQAFGMASNFLDAIPTGDKRGMWDTLDPVYHLAGGRESGAGNVMSDAGVSLTKAGLLSGLPYMALAGAALKVIGGLTNAAFGIKEDKVKKAIADLSIKTNSNFVSNANSFDDIKGPASMTATDIYEGGWFSGGKAADKNEDYSKQMADAYSWADRSILNNLRNLSYDRLANFNRNYSALGGSLNTDLEGVDPSTAIGYSIYTDKYMKDKLKANSGMTNMFAGTPDIFGFGGGIYTKGANFDTGVSFIDKGGTHEENPNDGVQMGVDSQGVPNLVEEGEVRWNDYIFSDRLIVPRGKRGNYGKRARKYAEGGKLVKGKGIDTPYESKVLKPFEGLTFADAAKKILKRNGADERDDAITMRGIDAELSVLAGIQEKEREKEKLREMQETIDNMSPEEFAMLLQQMEAQQAALQQQEMAMQLQLMIPLGMELMQPVEEQLPIAALGGLLDTYNQFKYGGNLEKFTKDLKDANVSEEDYLRAFYSMRYDKLYEEAQDKDNILSKEEFVAELLEKFKLSPEEVLNDENFNKDFAETFLNRVKTITKQYNRRAKKQGIKVDDLLGATKAQYNRDLNQAILKGLTDADYDVTLDTELTFNNSNVSKAKDKQAAYNNAATYNDLIARGGRAVELDDLGRPTWESIAGLNKIDNSAEGFYNNLGELNEDALSTRGIYDYNAAQKSSIDVDDYKNVKLRGWNKNEDGTYTVSGEYNNPNQTSLNQGNSDTTYPIADIGDLKPGSEEYDAALKTIQDNADYKRQTEYVKKALEAANGNVDKLKESNPDVYNYIKYLDENSGNLKGKLLNEDGSLSKTAVKDYTRRREDSQYGIYHYLFDDAKNAAANRYYYKDGNLNVYISKPEGTDFTISESPTVVTGTDGTLFNDYEVTGLNKNRTLTLLPTGEVVDVTNINDKDNWKKLDKPVLTDNTDNLGYGIKGTTDWVDYGSSPAGKGMVTENDSFPKAASWPYEVAAGLQLGSLGYNILNPADYSNADALIKAALNAGNYKPIEFRPIGDYLPYKPLDIWYEQNRLNANARATDRAIMNSGINQGARNAALLANAYNNQIASGNLFRLALEYNDALRKQVGEFNKDTNKFNSEGFLKADMANQDAASRAAGYSLEGKKAAYAMSQAIADAKANTISAGLSGLGNLAMAYGLNKWNLDILGWKLRHNQYPISLLEGYKYDSYTGKPVTASKGGKLRTRRKRSLSF